MPPAVLRWRGTRGTTHAAFAVVLVGTAFVAAAALPPVALFAVPGPDSPSGSDPPVPYPQLGQVRAEFTPERTLVGRGIAFDGEFLYYTLMCEPDPNVYKITTAGELVATIRLGAWARGGPLAWDGDPLWTIDYCTWPSWTLYQVDATTGAPLTSCNVQTMNPTHPAVTDRPHYLTEYADGLHWGLGSLWISSEAYPGNWVAEVTPGCRILQAFHPPDVTGNGWGTSGIAFVGGTLWHAYLDIPTDTLPAYLVQTDAAGNPTGLQFEVPDTFPEDLEYDPVTFAPDCVLWTFHVNNVIRAYEIPCATPLPEVPPPSRVTAAVSGNDVTLAWNPSPSPIVDGYYVYGGPTPTDLDLVNPLVGPLTSPAWTDAGRLAAATEYYYTVRARDLNTGAWSLTTNTAGVFRVLFAAGPSAFSLPLQPLAPKLVSDYVDDIPGAQYVERLDGNGEWRRVDGPADPDDAPAELATAYVVGVTATTTYDFAGLPGAHVLYTEGKGFPPDERDDARARWDPATDDVALSWPAAPGATRYLVLRSSARDGFFGGPGVDYAIVANTTLRSYTDPDVSAQCASFPCESYYLVAPLDAGFARLASSYSSGVYLKRLSGSTGFGLPLRPYDAPDPDALWTVDTYVSRMQALGILYWQAADQGWVPHFAEMPTGVYDIRVTQAAGFQVTVAAARTYAFEGW